MQRSICFHEKTWRRHCLFKASVRVRHSSSRQPYGIQVMSVERDIGHGDFYFHRVLKMESSNVLMAM
jgi:hypothetical protein